MGFASYGIAITGMRASELGLNVVGHNISNISTPGFTKQQVIQNDSRYADMPGIGVNGMGTDVDELRQIRDNFLDINYRKEQSNLGYWTTKNTNLEEIQTVLNEPFGNGLQKTMTEFWNGWQELVKEPDNLTVRALLRQKANVMVNSFNQVGQQLSKLQTDINKEITSRVEQINDYAKQIADLNMKIKTNEIMGDHANDYRDQRNLLLDKLSKIVDIEFKETADNLMNVSVGSIPLVFGVEYQKMTTKENVAGSAYVAPAWDRTGELVTIKSGELKGYLETRGESALGGFGSPSDGSPEVPGPISIDINEKQTIPSIKEKLNALLNTLVTSINTIHSEGYGIDKPPTTGTDFFTAIDTSKPLEMGNVQVNPALFDLNLIAASTTGVNGDSSNAQRIVDLKDQKVLGPATDLLTLDEFYNDTVSRIGLMGQEASTMTKNQENLISSITNKKESISGVSMDEELSNMLKYQHAYQANARVLNIVDSMMDKIINELAR